MVFLSLAAFALLPLAALPFFISRRPHRLEQRRVSSLALWQDVTAASAAGVSRRRRWDWLLLPQVLLILVLVAALARPVMTTSNADAVFVIDVSASMGAQLGDATRLEAARERARQQAAALPRPGRIRVISAGATVVDHGLSDTSRAALDAQFDALRPGGGDAALLDAIQLARSNDGAPVFVFSDRDSPVESDGVTWVRVGTPVANVAVSGLAATASQPGLVEVTTELANYGASPQLVQVQLEGESGVVHVERALVAPGRAAAFTRQVATAGRRLTARRVGARDGLAADDRRATAVSVPIPVEIDRGTPAAVQHALRANPAVTVVTSGTADGEVVRVCAAAMADAPRRACGSEGNALVVGVPPGGSPTARAISVAAPEHPLLRDLDVSTTVAAAIEGTVPADTATVLTAGDTPLLLARDTAAGRVVYLNVDTTAVGFTSTTTFPLIVANAIEWAGRGAPSSLSANVPVDTESDLRAPGAAPLLRRAASAPGSAPAAPPRDLRMLLLLTALGAFAVERWILRRSRYKWTAPSVAVAILLLAAAADVGLPIGRAGMHVVLALDQSDSVAAPAVQSAAARAAAMLRTMRDGDRAGILTFGAEPAMARPMSEGAEMKATQVVVPTGGTNIESAITLARLTLPAEGTRRIVLFSDGRQTSGSAERAAAAAAQSGIAIDVVALAAPGAERLVELRAVEAPARARVLEPFRVAVHVRGAPGASAVISLVDDGGREQSRRITLGPTGEGRADFTAAAMVAGIHTYRAGLNGDGDTDFSPGATVTVDGPPALLYVGNAGRALERVVRSRFAVTHVTPAALPTQRQELSRFDAVVFDEVPASTVSTAAAEAVREYVERDGGGLLVLGSAATLDSAAAVSALAPVLPVDFRARGGRRGTSLAYVLLFDKSGSMADSAGGVPKIELARQSVMTVLGILPATTSFGVIAFDRAPHVVVPLATRHDPSRVAAMLRDVEAGGATIVAPALDLALQWASRAGADRRRVLLVSDGRTSAGDAVRLRTAARSRAAELSVVAIGADADRQLLTEIASVSGGRAYFPEDLRDLPAIVARDAAQAAGPPVVEERFVPRAPLGHPALAGIEGTFPPLDGYVVGALRAGAEPWLVSHLDDPVLAGWRFGVGRAAVYGGALSSAWSAQWRDWADAPRLWTQTLRWVGRRTQDARFEIGIGETDTGIRVAIGSARDGAPPLALADTRIVVRRPDETAVDAPAHLVAPGWYEVDIASAQIGPHLIEATATDPNGTELRQVQGFFRSANRERAMTGPDMSLLTRVATSGGGRILTENASPFDTVRPVAYRSARTAATLVALIAYVVGLLGTADIARWRTRFTGAVGPART